MQSVYNKLKGDGIIKVILKFIGVGVENNYQATVKIFKDNKKKVDSRTYNGEICLILNKCEIYKLEANFMDKKINTYFYTNSNCYKFNFNQNIILNRTIILSLRDYYYNIPIEKGEIILWQK